MDMTLQIKAVYQRVLLLRQRATESHVQEEVLEEALTELASVLEKLQTSEEELRQQNQTLLATRHQLEVERNRYRGLFHLAPEGYLVTDKVGVMQEANQAIADLLRVSLADLIGKPITAFISEVDRSTIHQLLAQLNQQGLSRQSHIQQLELQLYPRHGEPFDAGITLAMIYDSEGNSTSCRWLLRDITSHKQVSRLRERLNITLEQQIQERTAQLQQVLDFETSLKRITDKVRDSLDEHQILQAVVQELTQVLAIVGCETTFYDADLGTIVTRYRSMTSDNTAIAIQLADVDQVISMSTFPEGYYQVLQGQYLQFCELTPTVAPETMAILMCPIADEQTVIGGLHLFKPPPDAFSDLEIRLVQQVANQCAIAIRQARLYAESQHQIQALQQLHQLKDSFLSTVSHELRTPLANMNMAIRMLDLIVKQPDQFADQHLRLVRYLEILKKECHQEITLINDLLDLARLDTHMEPLVLTPVDLNSWVPQVIASFEERIHTQQQQLQVTLPDNLPTLNTDTSLLKRILTELLNNACKYTPPQEAIAITARSTDQTLQLSISNSGIDLPPNELERLFEKFYRVPTHDPWKHGGTGLGLALVKQQVERLGGTIEVSNPKPWLTFVLHLPYEIRISEVAVP